MSVINYENLSQTNDIRIIKTKRSIFSAMIVLLETRPLEELTISDLCRAALINRKTFYSHYSSIPEAFSDLQKLLISGYISVLKDKKVIFSDSFVPSSLLKTTNEIITENKSSFDSLYPYIRRGEFIRELALAIGVEVSIFVSSNSGITNVRSYIYAFVFSLTGLLVSYFDWIDSEEPCSFEQLLSTADDIFDHPLKNTLKAPQSLN